MTSAVRKAMLTAHVVASVGWSGAVAAFLALAFVGLGSHDAELARASYLALERVTWLAIVPAAVASLLSGIVQSLITPWGLVRHYWVVIKLALTVLSTLLLFVHTIPIGNAARFAADRSHALHDMGRLRFQLVGDAALAIVVLLVATVLAVYKPRGLTRYGERFRENDAVSG